MSYEVHGPLARPFEHFPEIGHTRAAGLAVSASVENAAVQYPEEGRTKGALFTQAYIHGGHEVWDDVKELCWDQLSRSQPPETRLRRGIYADLNSLSREATPDADTYLAYEFGNTIHDAFKKRTLLLCYPESVLKRTPTMMMR